MIRDLDLLSIHYIAKNMRAQDWKEISNVISRGYCSADMLAMLTMQVTRLGFIADVDGIPCAVVQAVENFEGNWSVGMFATDEFPRCWRAVFKHVRHVLIPAIVQSGGRYCEAMVHADNVEAQSFLKAVGLRPRSEVLKNYGAFGEPFVLYAITIEDLPHVLRTKTTPDGRA